MAALETVEPARLSGADAVEAMAAWERLARYAAAQVLSCGVEAGRAVEPDGLGRAEEPDRFAADEMRARLVLSRAAATRRHATGEALTARFPRVLGAQRAGLIDELRARAFAEELADAPDDLARLACARVLPEAPGLVLGALTARLREELAALDPAWAARRERVAVMARRVRAWPRREGTGVLAGYDLPLDRVAGGVARIEALAAAARRRGARVGIDMLRADAYMGLIDGLFACLGDDEIVDVLVAAHAAHAAHADDVDDDDIDGGGPDDGPDHGGPDDGRPDDAGPDDGGPDDDADVEDDLDGHHATDDLAERGDGGPDDRGPGGPGEEGAGAAEQSPILPPGPGSGPAVAGRSSEQALPARVLLRGRVEVRGRLSTMLGIDDLPGEVAGLGPLTMSALRRAVVARTGGQWRLVVTDDEGFLEFVALLRARPSGPRRGGPGDIVELAVPAALLRALDPEPDPAAVLDDLPFHAHIWLPVLAEAASRYREWLAAGCPRPTEPDPHVRFPHAELARWIEVRDRHCRGPGCPRPAHSVDLDHTVEHVRGGPTSDDNLAGGCHHDHRLKTVGGWTLEQPRPGHLRWISRAGAVHDVPATPILRDLPDARPRRSGRPRETPGPLVELLRSDLGDPTGTNSSAWQHGPDPPAGLGPSPGATTRYPGEPPY